MKISILLILIVFIFTLNAVQSISVVSSDLSLSTPACEGRPKIQEWIKQRNQIPIKKGDTLLVTISNKFNDDLKRLINSAEIYDQPYVILGLCEQWKGENVVQHFLETIKQNKEVDFDELSILFTDTNNLFVNSPQKLKEIYANNFPEGSIVFKAERYCFPRNMESQFKSTQTYKYLNSQAYFGKAKELLDLFGESPLTSTSDSFIIDYQNYFVNLYLGPLKSKFNMQVDSSKKIFASLLGKDEKDTYQIRSQNDINTLVWRSSDSVTDQMEDTNPILLGDISISFIQRADDIKKDGNWVSSLKKEDLRVNKEIIGEIRFEIEARFEVNLIQNFFPSTPDHPSSYSVPSAVSTVSTAQSKKVMIGLFLNENDIFVRLLLEGIENLDFPKENISFFINYYSKDSKKENADLQQWLEKVEKEQGTPGNYALIIKRNEKDISKAKREALLSTVENKCDFYFTTDAVLDNKDTLNHLINEKKRFISPLMTLHQSTFSNFWGQVDWEKQGFGKHALYQSIVDREYKGVLRVPVVWGTFLIDSSLIPQISENYAKNPSSKLNWEALLNRMESFKVDDDWWVDLIFSIKTSFEIEDGIWISNKEHFGLLIDKDMVAPKDNEKFDNENGKVHRELYAYPNNKLLFKKYYYNPDFYDYIVNKKPFNYTEPCIDAFAWEMMRPLFGEHLIDEAENYGKWSGGGHNHQYDPRIGGTESYPTQDIHLNQFGLHEIWLDIIMTDVATSADDLYGGIQTKGINIAFIVRYKPGHQSFLKPHHDSSLYTISVALNKPGRDFEGGGVRYVRRNCTFINPEAGYAVVHPGRVTHKHEGLETTSGTRYIFVTFVN